MKPSTLPEAIPAYKLWSKKKILAFQTHTALSATLSQSIANKYLLQWLTLDY